MPHVVVGRLLTALVLLAGGPTAGHACVVNTTTAMDEWTGAQHDVTAVVTWSLRHVSRPFYLLSLSIRRCSRRERENHDSATFRDCFQLLIFRRILPVHRLQIWVKYSPKKRLK